jgi:hypothetical protein
MSASEVRLAQQQALASFYEDRVRAADSDAGAIATSAVAMGALLVAAVSKFDPDRGASLVFAVGAGTVLVLTVAITTLARVARAGHLQPAVETAEAGFAALPAYSSQVAVTSASLAIWSAHAARAKHLSGRKRAFVRLAAVGVYSSSGMLAALGVAQVF